MPTITALKPQKNKKYVNIFVDGKFAFGIDLDNLYKYGIKVEREFTKDELDEINQASNFSKTFNKLLKYATSRPHSVKEYRDWFYKKQIDENMQDDLLQKLSKFDLVDDEKFASWWVRQRIEFKKKSKKEISFELIKKGVDRKIIEKVINEADIDEFELAKKQAEKKLRSLSRYDEETREKKLKEFLLRKGFDWEVVKKVIENKIGG